MSLTLREQGIETTHDRVVSLVAERWAKAFVCKVTIKTGFEQNPWAEPHQLSDIVGWYVSSGGNTMEWMAEVETEDSLGDAQVADKWKRDDHPRHSLLSSCASRAERYGAQAGRGAGDCRQLHLRIHLYQRGLPCPLKSQQKAHSVGCSCGSSWEVVGDTGVDRGTIRCQPPHNWSSVAKAVQA